MRTSEQINDLAAALAKAQSKIEGAVKDKGNPAFRSKYADLGAVWDAVREPLSSNGLSVVQFPRTLDGFVEVETILIHSSGQFLSDVFAIPVSKRDAHGYMSACTYARRGGLMAVAGVAPIDDDGNGAVGKTATDRDPIAEARKEIDPDGTAPRQYTVDKAKKAAETIARAAHMPGAPPVNDAGPVPPFLKRPVNGAPAPTPDDERLFVGLALDAHKIASTKEDLSSWWKANLESMDKLSDRAHEAVLRSYDGAMDRVKARV